MPSIQLPDGHSAVIRDGEVRRSDSRFIVDAADKDMTLSADGKNMQAAGGLLGTATMQDAVIVRFVASWTLTGKEYGSHDSEPLPITMEIVQDLPMRFYKPLARALQPQFLEVQIGMVEEGNGQLSPLSEERLSSSASTE